MAAILLSVFLAMLLPSHSAALSITTSSVNFPAVFLNGYDQTVLGTTDAWRVDAAGESGGWHVTISATDFTDASSHTFSVSNLEFRLLDENISLVSGDPNLPSSTQVNFFALGATPVKFLSASSGTGDGVYDLSPDFRLIVPAETYAGDYSATITISVNSGP